MGSLVVGFSALKVSLKAHSVVKNVAPACLKADIFFTSCIWVKRTTKASLFVFCRCDL